MDFIAASEDMSDNELGNISTARSCVVFKRSCVDHVTGCNKRWYLQHPRFLFGQGWCSQSGLHWTRHAQQFNGFHGKRSAEHVWEEKRFVAMLQ